jgi:peptidoglycan/xylan/chitin deacetylase (PgdA/CDA1 family)
MAWTLAVCLIVAVIWIPAPFVWRRSQERALAGRCRAARILVLTYDDGPDPEITPRLLELLKSEGVKASFFLIGYKAKQHVGLVQQLLADGHEVASHSQTHLNAWKTLPLRWGRDVALGVETITALGGTGTRFRPPWGKLTALGVAQVLLTGLDLAWWTVNTQDVWARRPINQVLSDIERKGGGVILMHDTYGRYPPGNLIPSNLDHILALTRSLIEHARDNNYRMVRLCDLDCLGTSSSGY